MQFKYEMEPSTEIIQPFFWFIFQNNELLILLENETASIPQMVDLEELKLSLLQKRYFGQIDNHPCYFVEIPPGSRVPEGMSFLSLRKLYGLLTDDLLWIAGRAFHLLNWDRNTQYCGRCGEPTELRPAEQMKACPSCGYHDFPRISPAVIVGVLKENQILLANGTRFRSDMYSVLAGFVEPGESLEDCVRREIKEEVGIEVGNIRYFGSQAWPFPDSLMIGFLADYTGGVITIDKTEINDAGWFTADKLPLIPGKISIARRIIDWFIENN
ncbi:MAG: NAD(+) diphosphatase [Candidatus Odinarchaeota archaeon]